MKIKYNKPAVNSAFIHLEWTIAEGSVFTGPTLNDHIPIIENFDDSYPIIDDMGDI